MTETEPLLFILYVSRNAIPEAELPREIPQILESSRRNNAAAGITGALIYSRDSFAQALEGPTEAVMDLFRTLSRDLRHAEVVGLATREVQQRQFGQWSMANAGRREDLRDAVLQVAPGRHDVERMLLEGAAEAEQSPT